MDTCRNLKRLTLLSEALKLEKQEFDELDSVYRTRFEAEFTLELEYLGAHDRMGCSRQELDESMWVPESESVMKKLYRRLAMETHPDTSGYDSEEQFQEISQAYDDHDMASLLSAAAHHMVDVNVTPHEMEDMEKQLAAQRRRMELLRGAAHWVWARRVANDPTRERMAEMMGVNNTGFEKWRKEHTAGRKV